MTNLAEQFARGQTTTKLLEALAQGSFVLYGQPIVALDRDRARMRYLEVLVRYLEEENQCMPPGGFIETLEELNLMAVLDRWVINRVIRALLNHAATEKGHDIPCYSVNLSVDSLYDDSFGAVLLEYSRKNRVPAGRLSFEIPERDAQVHADALRKLSSAIGPMGFGVTLSSYTGEFVAPGALPAVGVDAIKIDGELVGGIIEDKARSARVTAIHRMCSGLGIRTVAEMVERRDVLDKLKRVGVQYAQGFAVAQPAPLQALVGLPKQ